MRQSYIKGYQRQKTDGIDCFDTYGYLLWHKPLSGAHMIPVPLSDFVRAQGQESVAKLFGISQAAISKAINSGRMIFVFPGNNGVAALELKAFPAPVRPFDREEMMTHVQAIGQHLNGSVQAYSTLVAAL